MLKKFPNYLQNDNKDCGPTCLKIIAKHYGKIHKIQDLRDYSETTRNGTNLMNLSDAAEKIGFRTVGVKLSLEKLDEVPLPCVLHWNKTHYVVLYAVKTKKSKIEKLCISDPAIGLLEYTTAGFLMQIGNCIAPLGN